MKPSPDQSPPASPITVRTTPATLYQIFRQTRAGVFVPCFQSDSPVISVESFPRQSPSLEAAEVRRWYHRRKRMIAAVKWMHTKSAFGFPSLQRIIAFSARRHAELAREIHIREFLIEVMRKEMNTTHTS